MSPRPHNPVQNPVGKRRRGQGMVVVALWVLSLCFNAFVLHPAAGEAYPTDMGYSGATVLAMGWIALAAGNPGWLANPMLLIGVIGMLAGKRASLLFTAPAAALAGVGTGMMLYQDAQAAATEADYESLSLGLGGYLWVGAIGLYLIFALAQTPFPPRPGRREGR